jgi:hypothetical protein
MSTKLALRDQQLVILSHGWVGTHDLQPMPEFQQVLRDIGLTQWAERG